MILKALNGNRLAQYGYADELEYTNDGFHGHQIGISIGVTDTMTGDIIDTYISETQGDMDTRKGILRSIIDDTTVIKIEKPITQIDNGAIVAKTIWFVPYAVKGHSVFRETVNFNNIVCADDVTNHAVVELLFSHEGLNRYMTISFDTAAASMMDTVYDLFEYSQHSRFDELATEIVRIQDDANEVHYQLDFYDEAGEKVVLDFSTIWDLRDALASVRLLEVDTIIEDD